MKYEEERIECMAEILESVGITASKEDIKVIVDDFSTHLEMENEMSSYQHLPGKLKEPCAKCQELAREIKRLNDEIEVYKNSVKTRRNADEVWIEEGTVRYL